MQITTTQFLLAGAIVLIVFWTIQKSRASGGNSITVLEAKALREDSAISWIDVREPNELKGSLGAISGVRNLPLSSLSDSLSKLDLPKDKRIILVCRSGNRSSQAQKQFIAAGYTQTLNMQGGMGAWKAAQ